MTIDRHTREFLKVSGSLLIALILLQNLVGFPANVIMIIFPIIVVFGLINPARNRVAKSEKLDGQTLMNFAFACAVWLGLVSAFLVASLALFRGTQASASEIFMFAGIVCCAVVATTFVIVRFGFPQLVKNFENKK